MLGPLKVSRVPSPDHQVGVQQGLQARRDGRKLLITGNQLPDTPLGVTYSIKQGKTGRVSQGFE